MIPSAWLPQFNIRVLLACCLLAVSATASQNVLAFGGKSMDSLFSEQREWQ